jgi:hypothetical protein
VTQVQQAPAAAAANGQLAGEDVGNIVELEHVNTTIPDQPKAIAFYLMGMGFSRDPYMNVGLENMWVNVGEQQFHLPTRGAQVLPGHIGVVVPNLDTLVGRLESVKEYLKDTKFGFERHDDYVSAISPWGNELRAHEPDPRFGDARIGIPYVEVRVRPGAAAGIVKFYERVMKAPGSVESDGGAPVAKVRIGTHQWLAFRESDEPIPPYDKHHIAIYIADFSGPYSWLQEHGLVTEEVRNHQCRFEAIVDPDSGEHLHTLEHEVRSLYHTMWRREMVNRNAEQSMRSYCKGGDAARLFG